MNIEREVNDTSGAKKLIKVIILLIAVVFISIIGIVRLYVIS